MVGTPWVLGSLFWGLGFRGLGLWGVLFGPWPHQQYLVGHDLGHMALVAVLGGIGAGLDPPADAELTALGGVPFEDLGGLSPGHDLVPIGTLHLFPFGIGVMFIGGQGKACHFAVSLEEGDLGVFPHISDQLYMVSEIAHDKKDFMPQRGG